MRSWQADRKKDPEKTGTASYYIHGGKNRCSAREFALAGGLARTRCVLPPKTACEQSDR